MEIPVLLEPTPNNGFHARSGPPLDLSAEGRTPEEALHNLRELVRARVAPGSRIVTLNVLEGTHPWATLAGMFEDEPLFDEWQQAIAERRKAIDEDPEIP